MTRFFRALCFLLFLYLVLGCIPALAKKVPDSQKNVYIIRLTEAPLATYDGGVGDLKATRPAGGKLDVESRECKAYRAYLKNRQEALIAYLSKNMRSSISVLYRYDVVFNGLAVVLTGQEAQQAGRIPGVADVQQDKLRKANTNVSPGFLNCDGVWDGTGTGGLSGSKGEGVIVGVVDTGIWPEHASFADDGSYPAPPSIWKGDCRQPDDGSQGYQCGNKLVGVDYFLSGYVANAGGYDGLFLSGRDDDGHGTHTASTAAGNENVSASIYGISRGLVSGMAPRAHVAAYKGLGPRGGYNSDLVACIDQAVADGVDAINYSIGSNYASDPWNDADAVAFLNARAAGVFVATSAGNDGPGDATVGSPANAPWMCSVGASYFNRLFLSELTFEGPGSPPAGLQGATTTPGVADFDLVNAEGIADITGDTSGYCDNPFPSGTFEPDDAVLCRRGGNVTAWVIGNFIQDAGGGAVILYNSEESYDYSSYLHPIPSVICLRETGLSIRNYLDQYPGQVKVSFSQGAEIFDPDPRIPTDTVVGFSSRGPAIDEGEGTIFDFLKPNVTAPGIHVLAGASPEHVTLAHGEPGAYGQQGEYFQVIQGTSMSSPHVAGAGALLTGLHPDWTPAEIESALMSTAIDAGQSARGVNGDVAADIFDMGAGRIDVSRAARAGFVLDETPTGYASANPAWGGHPETLNIAGLVRQECLGVCSWQRTVRGTAAGTVAWTAAATAPPGISFSVTPETFSLSPGETRTIDIRADIDVSETTIDQWTFGSIRFTPDDASVPEAHFPAAVKPIASILPELAEIETRRNAGSAPVTGFRAVEISKLGIRAWLDNPESVRQSIYQDTYNLTPYDDLTDGAFFETVTVPSDAKRFLARIAASEAPDIDLYVGMDANGNGLPDEDEELCSSTTSSYEETCEFGPGANPLSPGKYWVLVQNWTSSGTPPDDVTLETVVVDSGDTGRMSVTGPSEVPADTPFDVRVFWDESQLEEGDILYGVFDLGTDAPDGNIGEVAVNIYRRADDVVKEADKTTVMNGVETVTYTISIQPNITGEDMTYTIADTIAEDMAYVPGSVTGGAVVEGNRLSWTGTLPANGNRYVMTTSADDPMCDTGFGGYVDLEQFAIYPNSLVAGDSFVFTAFDDEPIVFYGIEKTDGFNFTDDGFGFFDSIQGDAPWQNQDIPAQDEPNDMAAIFWRDLEIVYDSANNRGVSLAVAGSDLFVIEYDDAEPYPAGSTTDRFDFEMVMYRQVDDTPGAYEIVFAYDNMTGDVGTGTVGVENIDGTKGNRYLYDDGTSANLYDGLAVCFDWVKAEPVVVTYQVETQTDIDDINKVLTNRLVHETDNPGSLPAEASVDILVIPDEVLDTDGDMMTDSWEIKWFGDLSHDGAGDEGDSDGVDDLGEFRHGTNPLDPDTDGDRMPDGWEVDNDLDPLADDSEEDPDGDYCNNLKEYRAGTDPHDPESHPFCIPALNDAGIVLLVLIFSAIYWKRRRR